MKMLEDIWNARHYEREVSYIKQLGLMLQPDSFAHFGIHADFVDAFRLWTQRDSFRGLDLARVWSLILNAKHVLSIHAGSLAELGVYQGQSSALLSFYAEKFGRKIYLADTFEGFAEEQFEPDMGDGKKGAFRDISLEAAQAVVGKYAGNRWIIGMFPDSVTDEMRADTYAFVSIDCDIYEPISEGLTFFWPRMVPGGMVFVHDYSSGHWPGATRAVDEFCARHGVRGVLLPDLAGSYVLVSQDTASQTASHSRDDLGRAYDDIRRLERELSSIQNSNSWRLTAPLREFRKSVRNVLSIRLPK